MTRGFALAPVRDDDGLPTSPTVGAGGGVEDGAHLGRGREAGAAAPTQACGVDGVDQPVDGGQREVHVGPVERPGRGGG